MWRFRPDLTLTQVNWRSAFEFDGNRATVSLSPLLYPQAHSPAAVSAWRSQSKFKVFSDAQGKWRDDLFHQQRAAYRLLLNIPPTVMLRSQSWCGCTTWDGFSFCCPSPPPNSTNWDHSMIFSCSTTLYFRLWQDMCSNVTRQHIQCQAAKHWTTNPTNPFPCARIILTTRFQECGWPRDYSCLAMESKNVDVQMFFGHKLME